MDRLVVVGASAGGIEALSVVVSGLPATFPAPIVVAQHLHPDRPSSLVEIIQRRTELRVTEVADRAPLEAGTVFIVPPNRHVSITDHEIRLDVIGPGRPKPSVDRLLETSAAAFQERLIAVILSGTGSDGAAGAQHVAAAGGTVIAQDPETAAFPSMPRSLLPQTVDAVTRVESIGPLLDSLVSGATDLKDGDEGLDRFLDQLRDRNGIDFRSYKRPTVIRRIGRRIAATRSTGLADYRRYVLRNPDEVHRLRSSLLIKVTEFFRDPALFTELRTTILPSLIERAGDQRELRLWSAGCATGEEAYTLAILVAEVLGEELPRWSVRIFATDADPEAIAFARRAVYPSSALGSVPEGMRERHFRTVDGEHEVAPQIRAMTVFGEHDLGQRAPFPRIDLVLCRNVLIYFTPDLQRRAMQLFAFSLRPGGFLVLGKSETTSPQPSVFVVDNAPLRIFRRSGERTLVPTFGSGDAPAAPVAQPRQLHRRPGSPALVGGAGDHPVASLLERAETVLLRLPVGVCVVDASYDALLINAVARTLLGIHGAAVGQDFVHQARTLDSARLRDGLDKAIAGSTLQTRFEVTSETPIGDARTLELGFSPLSFGGSEGDGQVVVTVVDVSDVQRADRNRQEGDARALAEIERLGTQVNQLGETNRQLLHGNEELVRANQELRNANEELTVYNEELQAASEEVETLNEELQATNEELETLNEELQATIEELNTTNEDLAARTSTEAPSEARLSLVPEPDDPS